MEGSSKIILQTIKLKANGFYLEWWKKKTMPSIFFFSSKDSINAIYVIN